MIQAVSDMSQFRLEALLGSKVVWGVLRVLLSIPIVQHGPTEIARAMRTSHSSVARALNKLRAAGLCSGRDGRYRISPEQPIVKYLWLLLQAERYRNLPAELVNKLELLLAETEGEVCAAILFGSWSRGLADERSDVDVCLLGKGIRSKRFLRQRYSFEVHAFAPNELVEPSRTVVLDALTSGIPIKHAERVYDGAVQLRSFPKSFMLTRLEQAQDFLALSEALEGVAQEYYLSLADRTLQQLHSILERGRTISRREATTPKSLEQFQRQLSTRIAREADRIWLT